MADAALLPMPELSPHGVMCRADMVSVMQVEVSIVYHSEGVRVQIDGLPLPVLQCIAECLRLPGKNVVFVQTGALLVAYSVRFSLEQERYYLVQSRVFNGRS